MMKLCTCHLPILGLLLSIPAIFAAEKTEKMPLLTTFESMPDELIKDEVAPLLSDKDLFHLFIVSKRFEHLLSGELEKRYWSYPVITCRELNGHAGIITSLAFSSDSKILASGGGYTICLWNVENGELLNELDGHDGVISSLSFSPNCKVLASGSWDDTMCLWNVENGKLIATQKGHIESDQKGLTLGFDLVAFLPDGKVLVAGGPQRHMLLLWNIETGALQQKYTEHIVSPISAAFSRNSIMGYADQTICIVNFENNALIHEIKVPIDKVWAMALSPNGKILAMVYHDGATRLWNVENSKLLLELPGYGSGAKSVAFSPGGKVLAIGYMDGTIFLWDIEKVALIHELKVPAGWVNSMVFSPDGKVLASGFSEGKICLWYALPKKKTADFCSVM